MKSELDADVSSLVTSAFDEMDCIALTEGVDHGGNKFAYVVGHGGCHCGFVCESHYRFILDYQVPLVRAALSTTGVACYYCKEKINSVDEWAKIYPI